MQVEVAKPRNVPGDMEERLLGHGKQEKEMGNEWQDPCS
jgi:hypothetical protein